MDVINAMTNKEAVADFGSDPVEAILDAFNNRVLGAVNAEGKIDEIILHNLLM